MPKPAAPKPDDGVDTAALRARWQEKSSNRYSLEDRIFFLMELLDQLPAQKAGERQELTDLRSEMNSRLESYWKGLHHRLTKEGTEDADRRVMAKVIQERICSKAQPFIAAHPSAEFSALCGTISGILDAPPMPQPEQPPVQKEPAAQSTEDALHLEWQMAKTRGDFAEADFLLRALDEGKGNEALREEMLHTLEDKWKAWREMLGQQTDAEERDRRIRMIARRFPKERVKGVYAGRPSFAYDALCSAMETETTARQQEKPKPAPQAPKTISPEAIRREWKRRTTRTRRRNI